MYGTPVLGADISGIPELIAVGKTGELFESGNALDLKRQIRSLWADKLRLLEYGRNCENTHFDNVEQYCRKLLDFYC